MSRIKTFCLAVFLFFPGAAPAVAYDGLSLVFAECAGRYSAEREHAWLTGNGNAEHLEDRRMAFLSLLEASMPEGLARNALAYRIEVKVAHASLLTLASFGADADRAARAGELAELRLGTCQRLLLDS